jgi:hypothetical protein
MDELIIVTFLDEESGKYYEFEYDGEDDPEERAESIIKLTGWKLFKIQFVSGFVPFNHALNLH